MKTLWALAALLCLGLPARAEVTIEGPSKVPEHKMVRLRAVGYPHKAGLLWRWDKKKLDGGKQGDRLWLVGPPGTYVIEVVAVLLDKDGNTVVEEASLEVTIGKGPAPGPDPGPDPGPRPNPVSPLAKKLREAYDAEAAADKADSCRLLAEVYDAAAGVIADKKPTRMAGVWAVINAAEGAPKVAGKVLKVQGIFKDHCTQQLPLKASTELNDDLRKKVVDTLKELAAALREAIK